MSSLEYTEPLWCEQMQDMSGYVLPDIISPPLDEQFQLNFSTAQTEHDFDLQNSGNPSPEELLLREQTKVLCEDSITFDNNSNYSDLHTKMKAWLPKISAVEIDEFATTNMISGNGCFPPCTDSETIQTLPQPPREENRPSATDAKQRHLSIFDCEEPHIKDDQDILSLCYNDIKPEFDDLTDDVEVAEEVVVTTVLDESKSKMFLGSHFFDSASPEYLVDPKEETMLPSETNEEISSPLGASSLMETSINFDSNFSAEDDLYSLEPEPQPRVEPPRPTTRLHPPLRLNIEAASQLPLGGLLDTPEMLNPVLKPEDEFDLVNFLLTSGDSNSRLPATPVVTRPCPQRRGKSHLSIADLKECHKYGRGKPSPSHSPAPSPSPSCSSGRPARKSATKFKRLLEEGLLDSTLDSGSVSSEDEDVAPKSKRRRSISSTSSRKRLNSDSDLSSVGTGIIENSAKYRERRDRNNLSSKRSRQKRKMQQEQKQLELKDLEHQNRKLRRKADALAVVLDKVHKAWKEYLKSMKKD